VRETGAARCDSKQWHVGCSHVSLVTNRVGAVSLVLLLSACSAGASDTAGAPNTPSGNAGSFGPGSGGFNGGGAGSLGTAGSSGTGGMPLPPETELESSYEVPVATGHFIWVANPQSGRVAYVNATTLEVHTIEAGNAPTYMAAIPGSDDAVIVLNVLSDDATVLRAVSGGLEAPQTIRGVAHGANAISVASDGTWAIAWTDARRIKNADPFEGYQDLTVIKLDRQAPAKTIVSGGFRPVSVAFAGDGSKAFAVTEDGITVIDLTSASGPRVVKNVIVTDDPTEDADTRDVSVTPNGGLALIRHEGSATIGIVDLASGVRSTITLSGAVTDLDLTSDGKRGVAVVRDTSEVVILPLEAGVPASSAVSHVTVTGEIVGSVALAPGGNTALLYSNAIALERITVLTLAPTPSFRVVKLHAPVLSVFPSGDAANAVVLHAETPNPTTGADAGAPTVDGGADGGVVDAGPTTPTGPRAGRAFSLVPLTADLPARIQTTDAPPESVVLSPDGKRTLITIQDDVKHVYAVYMGLFPTLEVQRFGLASPPIAAGVVAGAGRGYVAQKHPEGRITFVTLDSGEARTLTGFELGSRVVDWTQP
jgi:hypothetical protein